MNVHGYANEISNGWRRGQAEPVRSSATLAPRGHFTSRGDQQRHCDMLPVIVVGGGVIGLCTAFALQQRGVPVTVIDAGPRERAASHVNAGWVVPTLAEPVPAPGLIATSLRWMLHSESPLYIRPRLDPAFLRWTLRFWRHCNA